ncbi:FKBP-type peptidyl-prolyl cis-trans isomerase [Oxalobacteraceae bacterium A2-2]
MFQVIAAVACAVVLAACGGGSSKTSTGTTTTVAQPAFKTIDTVTGTGLTASYGDVLVVDYVGYLYDATKSDFKGSKIDSSIDRAQPETFTLGVGARLVGWDQGIVGMLVGGKRTLILPSSLAYGATARTALASVNGNTYAPIPANSPVVYDITLISVVKATTPVTVPPPTALLIHDDTVGTGDEAVAGKTVTINYAVWLYDGTRANLKGTQIDSSTTSGAFTFVVDASPLGAIVGVNTGVKGLKVGGTRTLTIPSDQAYGTTGNSSVPPNTALIFTMTLTAVK